MSNEKTKGRSEKEIFDELSLVCTKPGFIHAIGMLCFRDNVVGYAGTLKPEDYAKLFSPERLIRTETSTLIGLMARAPIDRTLPSLDELKELQSWAEGLLGELHNAMMEPFRQSLREAFEASDVDPSSQEDRGGSFETAEAMREPIFYGPDSAYSFQYRDLAPIKYSRDEDWMRNNKGFSIEEAAQVVKCASASQDTRLFEWVRGLKDVPQEEWTVLPGFKLSVSDIVASSALPIETVRKILDAFSFANDGNPTFNTLSDFNAANAFPILKLGQDEYVLFQYVGLTEALYDTPFYWMGADKAYAATAMDNRGKFTEELSAVRLEKVFGKAHVFRNVKIWKSKEVTLSEIDALVLFADRAVVVQAKSKKLTLEARKGNDLQLRGDFQAAIQDAYDQAFLCSEQISSPTLRFTDANGEEIKISKSVRKIHPICVVSDHYPALSFQARQFLKSRTSDIIVAPLVCDVFALDTITEFLETPLRLLSYLELRAMAGDSVLTAHEITILGFHLKQNLWLGDYDMIQLHDDISTDIDIAMLARRAGIEGEKVPPGILTYLRGLSVARLIEEIEQKSEPWPVEVGLELLKLGSDTVRELSFGIDRIAAEAATDGMPHDITISLGTMGSGITVHCTSADTLSAASKLKRHCEVRKYSVNASKWYGIALSPGSATLRFTVVLDHPWQLDEALDAAVRAMPKGQRPHAPRNFGKARRRRPPRPHRR